MRRMHQGDRPGDLNHGEFLGHRNFRERGQARIPWPSPIRLSTEKLALASHRATWKKLSAKGQFRSILERFCGKVSAKAHFGGVWPVVAPTYGQIPGEFSLSGSLSYATSPSGNFLSAQGGLGNHRIRGRGRKFA